MAEPETVLPPKKKTTPREARRPCLVVVWSADSPKRVGELLFAPRDGVGVLGRSADEDDALVLGRQIGGGLESTGALSSPHVSRRQLRVERRADGLSIERVGRCELRVNGVAGDQHDVGPGDVVELVDAVSFFVGRRPERLDEQAFAPRHRFGGPDKLGIVGESEAAWRLRSRILRVARRKGHALVLGASGTGKELVARALHELSERGNHRLISRNAATLPEGLVDAELFGNPRNYPNPGMPEREGLIGAADGSTLFVDEIGELPVDVQAHLLRVLDHGEYQRLGETRVRRADFRLIGATNRGADALKHDVAARFAIRVEVPDLNERRADVPLLAAHRLNDMTSQDPGIVPQFFDEHGQPRFSQALMRDLVRHHWQTNVRELDRYLWASVDESAGDTLDPVHLPGGPLGPVDDRAESEDLTKARIQEALDRHNGKQSDVWRELGLSSRHQLARLIKKYGVVVRKKG